MEITPQIVTHTDVCKEQCATAVRMREGVVPLLFAIGLRTPVGSEGVAQVRKNKRDSIMPRRPGISVFLTVFATVTAVARPTDSQAVILQPSGFSTSYLAILCRSTTAGSLALTGCPLRIQHTGPTTIVSCPRALMVMGLRERLRLAVTDDLLL